jgi:hypothetical protein
LGGEGEEMFVSIKDRISPRLSNVRARARQAVASLVGNVLSGLQSKSISHGSGQMRAQSISIQVSDAERCTAGCKFCISRTTPGTPRSGKAVKLCDLKRLEVGLGYAAHLGATHAILTGRADPTQESDDYLVELVKLCRKHVPLVDMHTNGYLMLPGKPKNGLLEKLVEAGLTMITFSIAHHDNGTNRELMLQKQSAAELITHARRLGLMVRVSLVTNTDAVCDAAGLMEYIRVLGNLGAQSVVVREIWLPDVYGEYNREVYDWNKEHWVDIKPLQDAFHEMALIKDNPYGLREGKPLPWGTPVFLIDSIFNNPAHGVNVTFARCDEANAGTVMKSIVHKTDGHGYRNWDHNGDGLY